MIKKAKLRRDYSKMLKKEGVQDIAASFKINKPCFAFQNTGECSRGSQCKFVHDSSSTSASTSTSTSQKKSGKRKRHTGAERVGDADGDADSPEMDKAAKEKAFKKAQRERKKKKRMHMARNSRGMPVFNNQIKLLLAKLQKDNPSADGNDDDESDSDDEAQEIGPQTNQ